MAHEKTRLSRASVYVRSRKNKEALQLLFLEIWNIYYRRLTVFTRRMSLPPEDVDDAVQEIMLKIYANLAKYKTQYAVSTWIYTIARNHCYDKLQKERTRAKVFTDNGRIDPVSHYLRPDEVLLKTETENWVKSFIGSLSLQDQQIAFLRFYEELSYKEISSILKIPVGTAKYKIHCMRKELQDCREKDGV